MAYLGYIWLIILTGIPLTVGQTDCAECCSTNICDGCERVPTAPSNGSVQFLDTEKVVFSCESKKYVMIGMSTRYCVRSEDRLASRYFWNGTTPTCLYYNGYCKDLPTLPTNGYVKSVNVDLIEYDCYSGYQMEGKSTRYCVLNKQMTTYYWNGVTPLCIAISPTASSATNILTTKFFSTMESGMEANDKSTRSVTTSSSTTSTVPRVSATSRPLEKGAVIGIAVGSVGLAVAIITLILCLLLRYRKAKQNKSEIKAMETENSKRNTQDISPILRDDLSATYITPTAEKKISKSEYVNQSMLDEKQKSDQEKTTLAINEVKKLENNSQCVYYNDTNNYNGKENLTRCSAAKSKSETCNTLLHSNTKVPSCDTSIATKTGEHVYEEMETTKHSLVPHKTEVPVNRYASDDNLQVRKSQPNPCKTPNNDNVPINVDLKKEYVNAEMINYENVNDEPLEATVNKSENANEVESRLYEQLITSTSNYENTACNTDRVYTDLEP